MNRREGVAVVLVTELPSAKARMANEATNLAALCVVVPAFVIRIGGEVLGLWG